MKAYRSLIIGLLLTTIVATLAVAQTGATGRGRTRTQNYTLTIRSNAPNSRVFVNAVAQSGTTPMEIELEEGEYDLVVRAPGYRDYSTSVTLSRDTTISARLLPMTYRLSVNANVDRASVYINGSRRGTAPVTLTLESDEYELSVRATGYENFERNVDLDRNLALEAELKPIIYQVSVNANVDGATVYVDDSRRGRTPATLGLEMGRYTIRVAAQGYQEYTRTISVNRNTTLNVTLEPAFSTVRVAIPEQLYNPFVKDPVSLFNIYVDEEPITDTQLRQMQFELSPGPHMIWFVTGGLRLEQSFVVSAAQEYVLQIGFEMQLYQEEGPADKL